MLEFQNIRKNKLVHLIFLIALGTLASCSMMPVRVPNKQQSQERANRLGFLAQRENDKLVWDECLAEKALERARWVGEVGDLSEERTGKPWVAIRSCFECRRAAENLIRGNKPAEVLHRALVENDTTRKNLTDTRFSLIGIGCHKDICVELFAGF